MKLNTEVENIDICSRVQSSGLVQAQTSVNSLLAESTPNFDKDYHPISMLFLLWTLTWISCTSRGAAGLIKTPAINHSTDPDPKHVFELLPCCAFDVSPSCTRIRAARANQVRTSRSFACERVRLRTDVHGVRAYTAIFKPTLPKWMSHNGSGLSRSMNSLKSLVSPPFI